MSEKRPMVSFCVPTYGRAAYIGKTLSSALAQTVRDFEIIVVDDQSPDHTAEVVESFSDRRIKFSRNKKNLGVPENLNYALSLAKGDYLVLLEDHDILEPNYLEETLALMARHPSVGFVATGLVTIDEKDVPLERYVENLPEFMEGRNLLRRLLTRTDCPFSVTTVMRRSALKDIEVLFDPKYWWYADQYLWLRLAASSDFGYVNKELLRFRAREPDHFLTDRFWETYMCLDRIHRDNWKLLHPYPSFASRKDALLYEIEKLQTIAAMRAGRLLRNGDWRKEDIEFTNSYLSLLSSSVLKVIELLPMELIAKIRDLFRSYHLKRTKIKEGVRSSLKSTGYTTV